MVWGGGYPAPVVARFRGGIGSTTRNCASTSGLSLILETRPPSSCHGEAVRPKVKVLAAVDLWIDELPRDEAC